MSVVHVNTAAYALKTAPLPLILHYLLNPFHSHHSYTFYSSELVLVGLICTRSYMNSDQMRLQIVFKKIKVLIERGKCEAHDLKYTIS